MPERFTETMRAASEAGWSHAVQHRFVNELFAGAVPDAVMARYLIQDHRLSTVSWFCSVRRLPAPTHLRLGCADPNSDCHQPMISCFPCRCRW